MKTMRKAFLGMIWSGSLIVCSLSAAVLVNLWAIGAAGGWEMVRLGTEVTFFLPVLVLCSIYRSSIT